MIEVEEEASMNDVTLLARVDDPWDGVLQVKANKALLGWLSPVLQEAFAIEPDCASLKVDGSQKAWEFIAAYPLRSTPARLEGMKRNTVEGAQLMAQVLQVAHQYNMTALCEDCYGFAYGWTCFDPQEDRLTCPTNLLWWMHLADKYDRLALAATAIHALVAPGSSQGSRWVAARSRIAGYGSRQAGEVWRVVCIIIADASTRDVAFQPRFKHLF